MKELLLLGANVNHNDQSMMLCSLNQDLHDACKNGDVTRMKELLTLVANIKHYDQSMMLFSLNKELYDACKNGNVTRMKELLLLGVMTNQLIAKSLKDAEFGDRFPSSATESLYNNSSPLFFNHIMKG